MKGQREETAVSYWDRGNWKKGTEEMIRLVIMVGVGNYKELEKKRVNTGIRPYIQLRKKSIKATKRANKIRPYGG